MDIIERFCDDELCADEIAAAIAEFKKARRKVAQDKMEKDSEAMCPSCNRMQATRRCCDVCGTQISE